MVAHLLHKQMSLLIKHTHMNRQFVMGMLPAHLALLAGDSLHVDEVNKSENAHASSTGTDRGKPKCSQTDSPQVLISNINQFCYLLSSSYISIHKTWGRGTSSCSRLALPRTSARSSHRSWSRISVERRSSWHSSLALAPFLAGTPRR